MTRSQFIPDETLRRLKRPLALTRAGLVAERAARAFWPLWTLVLAALSALMLGLQDSMAVEAVWIGGLAVISGMGFALWHGVRRFRWPTLAEAAERLDRNLPGRPIAALNDIQAIGAGDAASEAVWQAHLARMAERARAARTVAPDLRLSTRDPYALRYVALMLFAIALLFGSVWRVASVTDLAPGGGQALASRPSWEGWVEPPIYTGRPSLYLADIAAGPLTVPQGSQVTIRLYGEIGALALDETVSGRTGQIPPATEPLQTFQVTRAGRLAIEGEGGQSWTIDILADQPPQIELDGAIEATAGGELRQPFHASDDYGVTAGRARITLDLAALDRSYGLATEPDPREPLVFDLPISITGDRSDYRETLVEDMAQHPWAGLPVRLELTAEDAIGQTGTTGPVQIVLPGRRFFDPLAAAIIEQRRDLLWSRQNAPRVSQVLRAVSNRPQDIFRSETTYLKLRVALRRLEAAARYATVTPELQDETAQVLWDIAIEIEEGDLSDALERLRRAQDRLSEAIQNGANDAEIAELMQELREAMQDYMRQLAEQAGEEGENQQAENQDMQEITGDQLQQMLDRLQELMEQGRMAEAQELLDQLRQMMENMQIARGQPGQGQQGEGQQAMEGLAETLRQQQGLSDETFGDLQEQFGNGQQPRQTPGQPGEGQQGQQGQQGQDPGQSLADRQQALRNELQRQERSLPGAGSEAGDAAREALGRAGEAMDEAEEALRNDDLAGALDNQSDAMEALREGMRNLGEAMAEQQGQQGQQGEALGQSNPQGQRDPLGREAGQNGRIGTDQRLLQGEDVYRRAQELLDEIRRRSGDQSRPEEELDYLKRLLERF